MFLFVYPIDSSFILCYKTPKICCYRGYLFNFAKYGYAKRLCMAGAQYALLIDHQCGL